MDEKYLVVACGWADCGKQLLIMILEENEGVGVFNGFEYVNVRNIYSPSNFKRLLQSNYKVCVIKPFIREQHKYLRLNLMGIRNKPIFLFRNPAISWLVSQHKIDLLKEGKMTYEYILRRYTNEILIYFKDFLSYKKKNEYLAIRFEDLVSGDFDRKNLNKYLEIEFFTRKTNYKNFNKWDIQKIRQSIDLVSQDDFDFIYRKCGIYMKYFNFPYITKKGVMKEIETLEKNEI